MSAQEWAFTDSTKCERAQRGELDNLRRTVLNNVERKVTGSMITKAVL